MSSPYKTGKRSEALLALPEVNTLAQEILSAEKYEEANLVTENILGSKTKKTWALAKLKTEIGIRPLRPLFYLWPLLDGLPTNTRDCIRYTGDYLDLLTKELTHEKFGRNARRSSMGINARKLMDDSETQELAEYLRRYSNFIYTPGKHDFKLPEDRTHRFTCREVVYSVYIAAELGRRILEKSTNAEQAVTADNWYVIGGRWGSGERLDFHGPDDINKS